MTECLGECERLVPEVVVSCLKYRMAASAEARYICSSEAAMRPNGCCHVSPEKTHFKGMFAQEISGMALIGNQLR